MRQLKIVTWDPGFGEILPARWAPTPWSFIYQGYPVRITFDHYITAAGASPAARIHVMKNGAPWLSFSTSHDKVTIRDQTVTLQLHWPDNCRIEISIDADFVKGVESPLLDGPPAYFMGTGVNTLTFDVMDNVPTTYPYNNNKVYRKEPSFSNNFTMALDGELDYFTGERFCAALQLIAWSIPCSKIRYAVVDYYLPIVTFQFVNMAEGTATIAEARLQTAALDDYISVATSSKGLGRVIPGSFVRITDQQAPLANVTVNLLDSRADEPSGVLVTALTAQGFGTTDIVELILPADFEVDPAALEVEVVNHTSHHAYRQKYTVGSGVTVGGASPTTIRINTGAPMATPLDTPIDPGMLLVVRINKGIRTPPSCLYMQRWVWVVKTYSSGLPETVRDYSVTNPRTDTCIGDRDIVRVGINDPAPFLNMHWLNAEPKDSIAGEKVRVQFLGFRFSKPSTMHAKLALMADGTCTGEAPGTTIQQLDVEASASFAPTHEGLYDICIRHRSNWEPLVAKFNVRQAMAGSPMSWGTPTLFSYSNCAEMIKGKTEFCGCYYTRDGHLSTDLYMEVPTDTPVADALSMSSELTLLQGCCVSRQSTQKEWTTVSEGVFGPQNPSLKWGLCSM